MGEEPRQIGEQLYISLHQAIQQLGGQVSWDSETKIATAKTGQWTAPIHLNDRNVNVGGTAVMLSDNPIVEQGVMWVPATLLHDAFGYRVQADPNSQQVSISLPR